MDYKKVITQWLEFEVPKAVPRDIEVPLENEFINAIIGPRRAGKTYLCFYLMNSLAASIPRSNMLYLNFEDERLSGAGPDDMDRLMETFHELSRVDRKKKLYLFLDEVQNVAKWDAWVRRTNDSNKSIKMVLTGSSSKMLSRELSTKLRGRVLPTTVFPLSFREFLAWNGQKPDLITILHSKEKPEVKRLFSEYLTKGGYPATMANDAPPEQVLQEYFRVMIFKDVVERHGVRESKKLSVLADLLFSSATKQLSYSRLAEKMDSFGYPMSKSTVIEYLSYFEEAYLFFQNLKYEYSLAKQLGSLKKLYCIDNGLLNAVSFKFSEDVGKLLENAVFIELKRRGCDVYYHQNGGECDFLVAQKGRVVEVVQVTAKLSDDNKKRELSGLMSAMSLHKLHAGLILTGEDEEREFEQDGKTINIKPVWKWLLEG